MGRSARFVSAVFALVAFGSGCGGADKASPAPRVGKADSDRKAAVEAALQKYSGDVAKMDDEAISESYTTDGEMGSAGGKPVKGRAAIAHHLRTLRDYKVLSSVVTSESVTFEGSDAYQKGTFQQQVLTPSGKSIEAHGRLEAIWTLESDGVWRLKKMTAFPDQPEKPKG